MNYKFNNFPLLGLENGVLLLDWEHINRKKTVAFENTLPVFEAHRGVFLCLPSKLIKSEQESKASGFKHQITIRITKNSKENYQSVYQDLKGSFVAVIKNRYNKYEVLGFDAGLKLNRIEKNYTKMGFSLTFETPDSLHEVRLPYFIEEQTYNSILEGITKNDFKIFDLSFDQTFE